MARHAQTAHCLRRGTSCSNVVWVTGAALCTTVFLVLHIYSSGRSQLTPRTPDSGRSSGLADRLRAEQQHAWNLLRRSLPPRHSGDTVHVNSSPAAPRAAGHIFRPLLYPPGFRLSNLDNFTFAVNNDVCGDALVDAVMVVTSDTRKPSVRAAIRDALPSGVLAELRMRRVFLLAELASPADARSYDRRVAALHAENYEHGDLVAGRFQDAYHNLTYKHLMGLHWAAAYCPQANYIIKMDHDIAVDVFRLHERLATAPRRLTVIGTVLNGTGPIRHATNKWYVSRREFAPDVYPAYMSGSLYAITPDAAARLVAAAAHVPFFWVDDAFVTGVVRHRAVPELRMFDFGQLWGRRDDTGRTADIFTLDVACLYECAADRGASTSQCDTLHGLVWDNLLVMRMFMRQAEYCYRQERCGRRSRMPAACHSGARRQHRQGMPQRLQDIGDVDG